MSFSTRTSEIAPAVPLRHYTVRPRRVAVLRLSGVGADGARVALAPRRDTPAQAVFDFGEEVVGRAVMRVASDGPATVRVFYGEGLTEALVTTDTFPEPNWYRLPRDEYQIGAGQTEVLRSAGRRAFRYLHVYLPAGTTAAVTVDDVRVEAEHYPVREDAGWFSCSDPLLNRAWEISRRTVRLCMQHFYEDGVKRDGMLWVGDYRVEFLCNALLFGDVELAKRSLRMMSATVREDGAVPAGAVAAGGARHGRPDGIDYMLGMSNPNGYVANWILENYCCDYVSSLREYHLFTGDHELVRELWPVAVRAIRRLLAMDPMTAAEYYKYITDSQPDHQSWWGSPGALAMQMIGMARDAGAVAGLVEDADLRRSCEQYVAAHTPRVTDAFYDAGRQVFRDERGNGPARSFGWHVNAAAVLAGVVPAGAESAALLRRVAAMHDARRPMAGFQMFWACEALCRAGDVAATLGLMRRYYGHMLAHDATTTWDVVDWDNPTGIDRPTTHAMSHCHAWSAGAAYTLPAHVLGVQPATPGLRRVRVRPNLGGLAWASGRVPTAAGEIVADWEADGAGGIRGSISLPPGVEGELSDADGTLRPLRAGETRIG